MSEPYRYTNAAQSRVPQKNTLYKNNKVTEQQQNRHHMCKLLLIDQIVSF